TRIAYLANSFPEQGEPYVWEEMCGLRNRGQSVAPFSFFRPRRVPPQLAGYAGETVYAFPFRLRSSVAASWMCISQLYSIRDLLWRAVRGPEPLRKRLRALAHTWLGSYLAVILGEHRINH